MRFGTLAALDGMDFAAPTGSVAAVIGPSGCGKSTLLRVIAGLQAPGAGTVAWNGVDVTPLPPHERGFGLMFQDYALFPHRNVADNVAFGLRMSGVDAARRTKTTADMLDLVGLAGFADRAIDGLSGGEQQRVALARTLAPAPRLLMLDEPLGSLDRTLRNRLVADMRDIFATVGVTVIYVTHDQDEAFALADEVVVMDRGRTVGEGPPGELWANPKSQFVARFLGRDNVLNAAELTRVGAAATGAPFYVVPNESVKISPDGSGTAGTVVASTLRSGRRRTEIDIEGIRLVSESSTVLGAGDSIGVSIDTQAAVPLSE